jgi:hypothetical protein
MRPEMTFRTASKLLKWSNLTRLRIVIDGLRHSANDEEILWRNKTILSAEKIAINDSRVQIDVFNENIGFTNHSLRVQKLMFENANTGLMLEEDNDISEIGLNFLKRNISTAREPAVFTAYSSSNHRDNESKYEFRKTLFGQLWGNAINVSAYNELEKSWREKSVDSELIKKKIYEMVQPRNLQERDFARRATKYWSRYFYIGLTSPRHTDIALMYSIWKCNGILGTPWQNLCTDLSYLDYRGMNQRNDQRRIETHLQNVEKIYGSPSCLQCEINDSRIVYGVITSRINSIKYRSKNLKFIR